MVETKAKRSTSEDGLYACPGCKNGRVYAIELRIKDAGIDFDRGRPVMCSIRPDRRICCSHLPLGTLLEPAGPAGLAQDSQGRKDQPLVRGCYDYFPGALAEVSELSRLANEKHNPGQEMHWARSKSGDDADCIARHLIERGGFIEGEYAKPVRHSAALAWRALALLQKEIEQARGDGKISRGSKP